MGRTFVAWALANWALREPAHADQALRGIDRTLEEILQKEREQGFRAFLLPYARGTYDLALVPAGADAEDRAAVADMVDGHDLLGQHGRMPVVLP